MDIVTSIDFSVLDFIQAHLRCAFLDILMPFLSTLGAHGEIWILWALVLCCLKKYRKEGICILIGLLLGLLLGNLFLKNLIARPRPCWLNPEVPLLVSVPEDFSFPSGHTLSSFIAAFLLTKTNRKLGYGAIPLACLMAFSRLYLYVHFPTDILGGIFLAAAIAYAVWQGKAWWEKTHSYKT